MMGVRDNRNNPRDHGQFCCSGRCGMEMKLHRFVITRRVGFVRLQDVVNKVNTVCLFHLTLKEVRPGRPYKYLNIRIRTRPSRSSSAVNSRIGTKAASMFDVDQSTQE
jgi:hypothetical protein